jgi:hypothetical protein
MRKPGVVTTPGFFAFSFGGADQASRGGTGPEFSLTRRVDSKRPLQGSRMRSCVSLPPFTSILRPLSGIAYFAGGAAANVPGVASPAPPGWLLDERGQPTTDPGVLYREPRGSILPLGGAQAYKGFGIA